MSTPNSNAAINGTTTITDQVNDLLGTHGAHDVYEGIPFFPDTFATYDPDGPIVLAAGASIGFVFTIGATTAIDRVEIPLYSDYPDGAVDVLVQLWSTSSGVPAAPIVSATVPMEHLSVCGIAGIAANPLQVASTTSAVIDPGVADTASFLRLPPPWYKATTVGTAGSAFGSNIWMIAGVQTGTTVQNSALTVYKTWDGIALSPWFAGPTFPQGVGNVGLCYDESTQTFVAIGGNDPTTPGIGTNNVWISTYSDGQLSAWQTGPNFPNTVAPGGGVIQPNVVAVNGWVYSVGAQDSQPTLYRAQIANGQLGAWSVCPSPPIAPFGAIPIDTTLATVNGWLVFGGGVSLAGDNLLTFVAPINADGSVGQWANVAITQSFTTNSSAVNIGDSLISFYGTRGTQNEVIALTIDIDGSAVAAPLALVNTSLVRMWLQQMYVAAFELASPLPGQMNSWQVYVTSEQTSALTGEVHFNAAVTPKISVPLNATGLTPSGTYAIVVSLSGTPTGASGVKLARCNMEALTATYTNSGAGWSSVAYGTNIKTSAGSSFGRLIHMGEDSTSTFKSISYTTVIYNQRTGQPQRVLTFEGGPPGSSPSIGIRDVRSLSYSANGMLEAVT